MKKVEMLLLKTAKKSAEKPSAGMRTGRPASESISPQSPRSFQVQGEEVMASWLAQRVVQRLLAAAVIDPDDAELYTYGFFLVISKTLFFGITAIMGALLGILGKAFCFSAPFCLSGAMPAGSTPSRELSCLLLTALSILRRFCSSGASASATTVAAAVPTAVAAVCVLLLSPLDSRKNRSTRRSAGGIGELRA